jgi:hypothetical protein
VAPVRRPMRLFGVGRRAHERLHAVEL